jgi:O-acetylhomoserine (thiol)-lyase
VLVTAENDYGFDTLKIRGGYNPAENNLSVAVPIYQTAAFDLGDTARADRLFSKTEVGYIYSRVANPTVAALEKRIAVISGAAGVVAVSSGMAALAYAMLNVAGGGGRILTTPLLYGGTIDSFKKVYPEFGIEVDVVDDPHNPQAFEKFIKPQTKAIFVETISNPNAVVADLIPLSEIAHKHGLPLIVDNTIATPYLQNPFEFGADIVVYSGTKGLNGHGNAIAGLILEKGGFDWQNGNFPNLTKPYYTLRDAAGRERSYAETFPDAPFTARVRSVYLNYLGALLAPFDAYLILLGIETLSERLKKQVESTEKVVKYLEKSKHVLWVNHPSAEGSSQKALAAKYLPHGAGAVFSFGFKGSNGEMRKFIESLKIFSYHTNIGDARSLIVNVADTTHVELSAEEKKRSELAPETIRLSIGLEDAQDLIGDLDQAFQRVF